MKKNSTLRWEFLRYVINGLIATGAHYSALVLLIEFCSFKSAAFASVVASTIGITVSFLGCRYFVFSGQGGTAHKQAAQFLVLYAFIALIHGTTLYIWSDRLQMDYRVGFLFATGIQISLSYSGNKFFVFNTK